MNRRHFLQETTRAAAAVALAGPVGATRQTANAGNGNAIALDPTPMFELSPYLYMQFMEPLGATDGSVEAAWDHLRDALARRRRGGHAGARADDDAVGRHLCGLLSLAGRRRSARHAPPMLVNLLWGGDRIEPGRDRRVRRTSAGEVGAEPLDLRQLRIRRPPAVHEGQGQRPHGRREGSRRVGGLLQRPGHTPNAGHTGRRRRSASGTGRSATRRPTTGMASTSKPPRARPSSLPRPCGAADPAIQLIAWGDSGWAAAHGGGRGRACAVSRVPSHVRSGRPEAAGAARRAVPARSGCHVGAADEGVGADRREDPHHAREPRAPARFRSR